MQIIIIISMCAEKPLYYFLCYTLYILVQQSDFQIYTFNCIACELDIVSIQYAIFFIFFNKSMWVGGN